MKTLAYTYAVARPFDPDHLDGVRGIDGASVGLVTEAGVAAVVSIVPRARFDEPALRARLEDLDDLESIARAHHAVIDAVASVGVVLPFRLATIHHDETRVREVLSRRAPRFRIELDRLAGRVELGVKVYAESRPRRPPARTAVSETSGREYLRRRREQANQREAAWQQAADVADRVDAALSDLAQDRCHHRAQDQRLSDVVGENVLNASYLVEVERVDSFAARARAIDSEAAGARVVVTGPWPPYSFAELDAGGG